MRLYTPVHARFERFCRARVYGNLEYKDLMQESILLAYVKLDDLRNENAFLFFLFGIAIRILANNKKLKKEVPEDGALEKWLNLETATIPQETKHNIEYLHAGLAKLPEIYRETIILFEISGFSIREIAQLHDIKESAVKQRLSRGREQLLTLFSKQGIVSNLV